MQYPFILHGVKDNSFILHGNKEKIFGIRATEAWSCMAEPLSISEKRVSHSQYERIWNIIFKNVTSIPSKYFTLVVAIVKKSETKFSQFLFFLEYLILCFAYPSIFTPMVPRILHEGSGWHQGHPVDTDIAPLWPDILTTASTSV